MKRTDFIKTTSIAGGNVGMASSLGADSQKKKAKETITLSVNSEVHPDK